MTKRLFLMVLMLFVAAALWACDDSESEEAAEGMHRVTIYGESFITDGIPADEFSDGWAVEFEHFIVLVDYLAVGEVESSTGMNAVDLTLGGEAGHSLSSEMVPGGSYEALSYRIAPATTDEQVNDMTSNPEIVAAMLADGHSISIAGVATKGEESLSFDWTFSTATRYHGCEIEIEVDGNTQDSQLTIHGDHLFYDDLESEEPQVAFELIASADTDDDGAISMAELAAVDISGESRYQVGSRDISDLSAFISALTATLGHINGEGHCATN